MKLFNFFNKQQPTLVDIVNKQGMLVEGEFATMRNDLEYNKKKIASSDALIIMAYGYAQRSINAGLYLQGLIDSNTYNQAKEVFHSLQIQTKQTVDFQEKAAQQAFDYINSYNPLLTKGLVTLMTGIVSAGGVPQTYNSVDYTPIEIVLESLARTLSRQDEFFSAPDINSVISQISQSVINKIPNADIAYRFVMEELDAARQGDEIAVSFVENSGFLPKEYVGAMMNSCEEVDGADGPQQELIRLSHNIASSQEELRDIKLGVVQQVIDVFNISSREKDKMKSISYTSTCKPEVELQNEDGVKNYLAKLSSYNFHEICVELSNVLAARHNIMVLPSNLNFTQKQLVITDLNDKFVAILGECFGEKALFKYIGKGDNDMRNFLTTVNGIDEKVASMDLEPHRHGEVLIRKLAELMKLEIVK